MDHYCGTLIFPMKPKFMVKLKDTKDDFGKKVQITAELKNS